MQDLLAAAHERVSLDAAISQRARSLAASGLPAFDALHLALAEGGRCDMLFTMDDRFVRRAGRLAPPSVVRVENPVAWVLEQSLGRKAENAD
jgi:predicted nucleic acid-binding protein